jgi:membrane fusion protein, heavy metal efflux system
MFGRSVWLMTCLLLVLAALPARAHEGHDHDKPPPLNLPVAPRVVAVTPDFELVGVSSGQGRLTIFLHTFATNEPVKGAKLTVTSGANSGDAEPRGDGVFSLAAPWLATANSLDLVFSLTLNDGTQDLLAGHLQNVSAAAPALVTKSAQQRAITRLREQPELIAIGAGGLISGVLLTLLLTAARSRRRVDLELKPVETEEVTHETTNSSKEDAPRAAVTPLRRSSAGTGAVVIAVLALAVEPSPGLAASGTGPELPSVPATMATDLAQRLPDGTLFVPKATQHLLSVRTMLTAPGDARLATELTGTIIAGPEHFGRVQPGRPGRIEAVAGGLAYVGKRVEKGQVLAYVQSYIEAADRANIDSTIAETEARIAKFRTILSRYEKSPGSVPQVKVDEVRGEFEALTRKRAGLMPSTNTSTREPVVAPISGVVSVAMASIGQIVEARDVLFEIVDPSQFWIEAHGHGHEGHVVPGLASAVAIVDGARQVPLEFAGRGLALKHQATVLTFKITGRHDGLSIGMPVKVVLRSSTKVEGFIVPSSAIVRGQTGLPIVWIKTEPERFEPQTVKVDPLDGLSVVVTGGLKVDQRIVTDGVTLLNQVR